MTARTHTYYDANNNPVIFGQDMQAWQWKKEMPDFDLPPRIRGTLGYVYGWLDKGKVPVHRVVAYKTHSPSRHKCGAKCRNAKGPNCECVCGGEFHGIDS